MAAFKHNKKRNCGLVYEFLVRRLSKSMVDKNQDSYKRTMEILRKYYGDGTPLAEERELFDVIRNARGLSEPSARRVVAEVERHAKQLDPKRIDIKKSNLIKEVNYTFGQNFFSEHRVPDYRLLASIQMVLDAARTQTRLTESVQKIQLEEGLVRYMMTRGSFQEKIVEKSEVDALVMAMVAKRFNEKYSNSLNANQKILLEKYIRAQVTGDEQPLRKEVIRQSDIITEAFNKASTMKEVIEDELMAKKLHEAKLSWDKTVIVGFDKVDETVEDIMMHQKLVEEMNSNE